MTANRDNPLHSDPSAIAALASLAFGSSGARTTAPGTVTRHLAFLSIEALELDLSDPEQRDFGDYELLERLGSGGMGVVYRARQRSLDREVAVKLLSAGPWASSDFVERFRREAQSAARLEHPNIVAIHEIGSRDELNYFSMALVRGPNLAQLLERDGALPARQAARLMRTIADALHYAHRLGVLHLDLKPGNVLIDPQGEPQVADFGLARRIDSTMAIDSDEVSGTPSYMAPEQIELHRAKLSAATDIYGLGAILYELLTGHPPFSAATPKETLALALDGTIRRPRRYRADIPEDLEAICLKCLAREPGDRYPSAQALAEDLGRFLEGRAVSVRPLSPPQRLGRWARREPKLVGAIGLGIVALVTGLAAALVQREHAVEGAVAAREQTWTTRADAAWRLVQEGRGVDAALLLLDNLAEREAQGDSDGAGLERLRLGTLAGNGPRLIDSIATGTGGRAVDIDPSGERVATIGLDERVHLYDVADGRQLWQAATAEYAGFRANGLPPTRIRFSHDGRYLVTATLEPGAVFVIPHGRNNVLLDAADGRVVAPPEDRFPDLLDATFGSDGRYAVLRDRSGHAQFFRVGDWRPLGPRLPMPSMAGSWIVGDDGRFVARSANNRIELLDPATFQPRFERQFAAADRLDRWAAQPGGALLALGHMDGTVRILDSRSLAMRELRPAPPAGMGALAFSSDGDWLLAAARGHVFMWDVASGRGGMLPAPRQLDATRLQADSRTGTVFALAPDDAMVWRLAELPAVGLDMRARIAHARVEITQFGFSSLLPRNAAAYAPAAHLGANLERDGELRLWRWRDPGPLEGRAPAQSTDPLYFDGRHVAVVEGNTVRIIDVANGQAAAPALAHPGPVSLAAFTPDGAGLVTVSGLELRVFDWRTGTERHPPLLLASSPIRVAISPDSALLLATTGGYVDGHYRELASAFDLRDGRARARDIPLPGPVAGLRFSPNGRHLVHWRYGELEVRDAASLQPLAPVRRFGQDMAAARNAPETLEGGAAALPGETPVFDAAISDDGTKVTLLLDAREPDKPSLVQIDARTGEVLRSRALPFGMCSRLWPKSGAYDFSIWTGVSEAAYWVDSDGNTRPLPQAGGFYSVAQDLSRDQRWLATSTENGVMLADRRSGQWATPPFVAHLPAGDRIVQLAFAADGGSLLARTQHGSWVWWPLTPEPRPAQRIARHLAHLKPNALSERPPIAAALQDSERLELRRSDPRAAKPPPGAQQTVALAAASTRQGESGFVPIDLSPASNRPVDAFDLDYAEGERTFAAVPSGRQRMLGVDFEIGKVIAMRAPESPQPSLGLPASSAEVPSPAPRIAAVHVLIAGCCPLPARPDGPYAYLTLRYTDGTHARIPILHRRHLWYFGEDPGDAERVRIGWVANSPGGGMLLLYAPRLDNPHPERDVAALAFEASEYFASSPVVFAATAERARTATGPPADRASP